MGISGVIKYSIGKIKALLNHIEIGKRVYIGFDVKIVNRGKATLGNKSIIRPSSDIYIHCNHSVLAIGNNTEIGNHSTIASYNTVIIGNDVLTGPHVYIADHNHEYENINIPIWKQGTKCEKDSRISIGDGTWLGTNVVIAGNISIGKNCVIGANSVVTKDIPDYCVVVGSPCKIVKKYNLQSGKWEKYNQ